MCKSLLNLTRHASMSKTHFLYSGEWGGNEKGMGGMGITQRKTRQMLWGSIQK